MLGASKYANNTPLQSTKIFHYGQAHSENFIFLPFWDLPLPRNPTAPEAGLEAKRSEQKLTAVLFFNI